MVSEIRCLVLGGLLLAGCPGDDGGTPLSTVTMTSSDSTTGSVSNDETPDDEEPPDDDDNDSTTTTTGPDDTTTGGPVAACVDQNLGGMTGANVAMGNTEGAGDDFGACGGGSGSTTGWDTDWGSGTGTGGGATSVGFITGSGDGGTVGTATSPGTTTGGVGSGDDYVIQWTAPSAGQWAFSLEGSSYDTVLGIHPPMCGAEATACNDDCVDLQSGVSVDLAEGETIFIVIDGYLGETGSFTLGIEEGNIDCGGGISTTGVSGTASASGG